MSSEGEQAEKKPFNVAEFRMPDEHIYDGMHWASGFTARALEKIKSYDFRDDDIIISTYPKAGTTWMQEILWQVMNDGDMEASQKTDLNNRVPFIEVESVQHNIFSFDIIDKMQSPRLMKTHVHRHFFDKTLKNKKTKFIIVMRELKDTLVSFYVYYRKISMLGNFEGTFSDFLQLFREKRLCGGDFFDFNLGWWQEKDNPNMMFTTYEKMSADVGKVLRQVAQFVGKTLTEEQLETIRKNVSIKEMKKNPTIYADNVRKGIVGDWANYFTEDEVREVDAMYEQKTTAPDLKQFMESL